MTYNDLVKNINNIKKVLRMLTDTDGNVMGVECYTKERNRYLKLDFGMACALSIEHKSILKKNSLHNTIKQISIRTQFILNKKFRGFLIKSLFIEANNDGDFVKSASSVSNELFSDDSVKNARNIKDHT